MDRKVLIIAIDGLNAAGKSTQLRLIHEWLVEASIPTVTMKGDGSRKGIGTSDVDPVSVWWQENYSLIASTDAHSLEGRRAAKQAADRLNREIFLMTNYCMPKDLKATGEPLGVILIDRTVVSRLFIERRFNADAGMEDVTFFERPKRNMMDKIVLPDIIFLLHTSKDILLARNENREDNGNKRIFGNRIINTYYNDFDNVIRTLPNEIVQRAIPIDASQTIDAVFGEISSHIRSAIAIQGQNYEGQIRPPRIET